MYLLCRPLLYADIILETAAKIICFNCHILIHTSEYIINNAFLVSEADHFYKKKKKIDSQA